MALTRFSAASAYAIITLPQTTGSFFVFKWLSKQALKKVGITFLRKYGSILPQRYLLSHVRLLIQNFNDFPSQFLNS